MHRFESAMQVFRTRPSERNIMRRSLEVRRQKLLQEIARVDREIELARKSMERIEGQIAAIQQPRTKAA
jgi:hypothetical protein